MDPTSPRIKLEWVLVGLRPWQIQKLERLHKATNLSRSEMVRQAVDDWLASQPITSPERGA